MRGAVTGQGSTSGLTCQIETKAIVSGFEVRSEATLPRTPPYKPPQHSWRASTQKPSVALESVSQARRPHAPAVLHLQPGFTGLGADVAALLQEAQAALAEGQGLEACVEGLGGAYILSGASGKKLAIIKPCDEEPFAPNNPKGFVGRQLGECGLKPSVRVGEAALREAAAYLLDHDAFAGVPITALVQMSHPAFHQASEGLLGEHSRPAAEAAAEKLCSLQAYVDHQSDSSEMGSSRFAVQDVHRLGILDLRTLNTDRHSGNILVTQPSPSTPQGASRPLGRSAWLTGPAPNLVPIDHGFCLPEALEPPFFEWLHWPQASVAFSREELAYIAGLDAGLDRALLLARLPGLREACLRTLEVSTWFLQGCASGGLSLAEIGAAASRSFVGFNEEPSGLEALCAAARQEVDAASSPSSPLSPQRGALTPMDCSCGSGDSQESAQTMAGDGGPVSSAPHTPCRAGGPMPDDLLFDLEEEPDSWEEDSSSASEPAPPPMDQGLGAPVGRAPHVPHASPAHKRISPSNLGRVQAPSSMRPSLLGASMTIPVQVPPAGRMGPLGLGRVGARPNALAGPHSVARGCDFHPQAKVGRGQLLQVRRTAGLGGQGLPWAPGEGNSRGDASTVLQDLSPSQWPLFREVFQAGLGRALREGRFTAVGVQGQRGAGGYSCP